VILEAPMCEEALVGLGLVYGYERAVLPAAELGITADHFGEPALARVWALMLDGHTDLTVLTDRVAEWHGNPLLWLTKLTESGTPAHLPDYANTIQEAHRNRRLSTAIQEAQQASTAADRASILKVALEETGPPPVARTLSLDDLMALDAPRGSSVSLGIDGLDRRLVAAPGTMTVIAGRAKMGKTQAGLSFARNVALRGEPAAFVSAEMGPWALRKRYLDSAGGAPAAGLPLFFSFTPSLAETERELRRLARTEGIRLAVADYLQLLAVESARTDEEAVGQASRRLKLLAQELELPLIVLAQVNRACETRPDKRPHAHDLRSSGRIEQDADAIVMVYRPVHYQPTHTPPDEVELIIRANRHGPGGDVVRASWTPGRGFLRERGSTP